MNGTVRLDKWLWATRVFKSRSASATACRGSAVRHNGNTAKASTKVNVGDTITVRSKMLTRVFVVRGLVEKRVGAALVPEFLEDKTPESEYNNAREKRENAKLFSHKGKGRPTKKDRRDINHFFLSNDVS